MDSFDLVKSYLLDLDYAIVSEDQAEQILVIENEEEGIKNMILDVEDPILILEQPLFPTTGDDSAMFKALLQKNLDFVHGAFALTDDGMVVWRDTLALENLDQNELEGSIASLSLMLTEYFNEILAFAKVNA